MFGIKSKGDNTVAVRRMLHVGASESTRGQPTIAAQSGERKGGKSRGNAPSSVARKAPGAGGGGVAAFYCANNCLLRGRTRGAVVVVPSVAAQSPASKGEKGGDAPFSVAHMTPAGGGGGDALYSSSNYALRVRVRTHHILKAVCVQG